jgi:hypothetical protein
MKELFDELLQETLILNAIERERSIQQEKVIKLRRKAQELMEVAGTNTYKSGSGKGVVSISTRTGPGISNWQETVDFMVTENRFDLISQSILKTPWQELLDENILVPGTNIKAIKILTVKAYDNR